MSAKLFLKKIPLLGVCLLKLQNIVYWSRIRSWLPKLYPVLPSRPLIRLGPEGDGGYLVPDDLEGIEACFSPGVDIESGFELACAERGMKVFMADGSVDAPPLDHPNFSFTKTFLGGNARDGFITLDSWVADSLEDDKSDLLLQMDIEGYEYEVMPAISEELLNRFRIIVIELHDVHSPTKEKLDLFRLLLRNHTCVHIHPNNYCEPVSLMGLIVPIYMEFTFYRNDRVGESSYSVDFPHPLDSSNVASKTDRPLPSCWYKIVDTK